MSRQPPPPAPADREARSVFDWADVDEETQQETGPQRGNIQHRYPVRPADAVASSADATATAVAAAPPAASIYVPSHALIAPPGGPVFVDDGRLRMGCLETTAIGVVEGLLLGSLSNAIASRPLGPGAAWGAAFFGTTGFVTCVRLKARNGSVYDHAYDRMWGWGTGGLLAESFSEAYKTIVMRMPRLLPRALFLRSLLGASVGAGFGFVFDYFDIMRPTPDKAPATPTAAALAPHAG